MPKTRLDILLVERGLVESRAKAQAVIMAGQVRVDGQVVDRASVTFDSAVKVEIESGPPFVSRGGEKLQAALETFAITIDGLTCADVGASTGGFTDCLLQHGAAKVYAIDVGKGSLHWKLRSDPRVVVMEATNARYVESLPEMVQLVTIDASFISLKILLPVVKKWLAPLQPLQAYAKMGGQNEGEVVVLIKPQFEAGRKESAKGEGVIRDPEVHRRVLIDILSFAKTGGYSVRGLIRSPLLGPKGNVEFLAWLDRSSKTEQAREVGELVEQVLA
jgi:23S rRNA (cytidine1920-2'-O)/16S rRNA (cytidine1409-2'-O)-methyltransferase